MKPQICQVCGDEVVFGRLLATGAICVDCGAVAADVLPGPLAAVDALEPEAPTDPEKDAPAPRAAEEQPESKGEPNPPGPAGDRARDGVVGRPAGAEPLTAADAGRSTTPSLDPGRILDCGIYGCVRAQGHIGFHTTHPTIAKKGRWL